MLFIPRMRHTRIDTTERGFTILELIIVIGMIAIMSAVAIPMYMDNIPRFQLKGAVRMVLTDFQKARLEAVKRNCTVQLVFTPGTYAKAGGIGGYSMVETSGGTTLLTQTMPKDVTLYGTNFPSDTAGYTDQGLPSSSSGSVYLVNNKGTCYKLSLSTAGNVSTDMQEIAGFDVNGSTNPAEW